MEMKVSYYRASDEDLMLRLLKINVEILHFVDVKSAYYLIYPERLLVFWNQTSKNWSQFQWKKFDTVR